MSVSTTSSSGLADPDWEEIIAQLQAEQPPGLPIDELIAFRESEEGKNLVGWVKQKFQKCKDLRSKEEKQWNINLAMYNGNQWVQFYSDHAPTLAGRLGVPVSSRNRERQTINRIKPIIRTEMAKFTSQKPGATCIPSTDEDEDIEAAKAAEQVWISTSEQRNLAAEYEDAIFWMCITGNGFIKTMWDPEVKDEDGETQGNVVYTSVDPYKLFVPDTKLKDLQAQPYIFHAYARPMDFLELHYAEELRDAKLQPTCKEASSIQEESFAKPLSSDEKVFDSCMVYEFWVKPGQCKQMPQGGMLVMVEDIIVEAHKDKFPFTHGEYPFAHFGHIKKEGFYRGSVIEDLIDLQRDFNKLRSQIAESRKKMGKPQLTAQKGAVSAAKITNEIGVLIEYKAGMQPPTPLALQNMPQYIMQEVEFILRDMEDISGQHEVSKGQTPAGVTAATAIAYLQESDDSFTLPSFKNVERGYGTIARQTLQLFVEYADTPRLVKIIGKDDAYSTELLSGSDIKRGTDVRIEPGSAMPQSKAARQAFIMDLMTNGFVDPNEGLDMLQIGGTQKLIDTIKNDKRQAQRENIKFKRLTEQNFAEYTQAWEEGLAEMGMVPNEQGELLDPSGQPMLPPLIIPVNDWDNHEVHIEEHNRFRKTQEFEILSPTIKEAMQSHVRQHQMRLMSDPMAMDPMMEEDPHAAHGGEVDLAEEGILPPEDPNAAPEVAPEEPPLGGE